MPRRLLHAVQRMPLGTLTRIAVPKTENLRSVRRQIRYPGAVIFRPRPAPRWQLLPPPLSGPSSRSQKRTRRLPERSSAHLCKSAQLFHIAFLDQCPLYEFPAVLIVCLTDHIRASAAAIVAFPTDDNVLKPRKEPPNLMRDRTEGVLSDVRLAMRWSGRQSLVRVLEHTDRHFHQQRSSD